MHIARQTPQELVVKDGTGWAAALFLAVVLFLLFFAITRHEAKLLFIAAFFLLFAAAFARHTTVTLDGMQRIARWRSRTLLKDQSGSVPFDGITDILIDAQAGAEGGVAYRLSIATAAGNTPMGSVYSGGLDHYETLRGQILEFIRPGSPVPALHSALLADGIPADLDSSIRRLLAEGRKIDAVTLLRSRESISLTEAMSRINAIEKASKPIQ